jgi:hypothetical protein
VVQPSNLREGGLSQWMAAVGDSEARERVRKKKEGVDKSSSHGGWAAAFKGGWHRGEKIRMGPVHGARVRRERGRWCGRDAWRRGGQLGQLAGSRRERRSVGDP